MLIVFNKELDQSIVSIVSGDVNATVFYWNSGTNHGWVFDKENFIIRAGADDTTITFNNLNALMKYIHQYDNLYPQRSVPVIEINNDAYYDQPKTGSIISHSYENTDIEKDLINGDL